MKRILPILLLSLSTTMALAQLPAAKLKSQITKPASGLIIKGSQTPASAGHHVFITTTNDQGKFELKGLEPGKYKFIALQPATPLQPPTAPKKAATRVINGEEVESTHEGKIDDKNSAEPVQENLAARPGSPIGGIVVKGGKNPGGGQLITITTKNQGEFEFDVKEPGDYTFQVAAPVQTSSKGITEKGIKRTL